MEEILTVGTPNIAKSPTSSSIKVPLIELKGLTKKYGQRSALQDVTLEIYEGEFVCLVGQSGVGKTTLIKLLTKQEAPTNGQIYVAGRNLAELRANELPFYRRKIGVVFQDFKL